jgi:hypothetical protein
MTKINHKKVFALAFRTAIVLLISFYMYEIVLNLEKKLNKSKINNKLINEFIKRFTHFFVVFVSDLAILYLIIILLDLKF